MNTAIANHLNVIEEAILEVRIWAQVLWVRVRGLGCRFVSKKVVKTMEETKLERAQKVVNHLGFGKIWQGGNVVRVYFSEKSGYIQIGKNSLDCSKMKHTPAYISLRDANLIDYSNNPLVDAKSAPTWVKKGYASQLDYDMENPNGKYYG